VPEGLAVIPAVAGKDKAIGAETPAAAAKPMTEQERREKMRELRRDAGITAGGPPSPEAMARLQQLAKERGIELPANFGQPRGERGDRSATPNAGPITRTVYKLIATDPKDPKLQAVSVKLGITDGVYTEVVDGLAEGDVLVTSIFSNSSKVAAPTNSNPFGGGQRRF
jgi:HlyD family secretion protein